MKSFLYLTGLKDSPAICGESNDGSDECKYGKEGSDSVEDAVGPRVVAGAVLTHVNHR